MILHSVSDQAMAKLDKGINDANTILCPFPNSQVLPSIAGVELVLVVKPLVKVKIHVSVHPKLLGRP